MASIPSQLALARAVTTARRARLLAPDNSATDPIPLAEAVESGRAYFVTPRADLLVVDVDLPDDEAAATERIAAFDLLVETADRCGVPHVVVASGRPGHRHAYLAMGSGRSRMMAEQWCRARGLDLRERGVRPPGAPHRDGRHVAVPISPSSPDQVIAVLRSPVDPDAANRLARRLVPVELPARVRSALRHGHAAAGYESPSHARMGLAVAIRGRGGPRALLEMLLGDPTSPLGATYRARPGRWQQQELRRLWDKAGSWLLTRPATDSAAAQVDGWAAAAAGQRWSGMSGGTDLAVVESMAAVGRRAGTTAVGVALADLAVSAGISLDTARASVRRLLAAGWLLVTAEATPRTSRVYRLVVPQGAEDASPQAVADAAVDSLGDLGSDLARWRALGKVSVRVARALAASGPMSVPELGERLRMKPAAVRHHLRKLARYDLVTRDSAGTWHACYTPSAVEQLSVDMGVAGRRDAQRAQVLQWRARRASVLHGYRAAWLNGLRGGRYRPSPAAPRLLARAG